jgi:glycosyltransferase involved in cell wall biosynthesis
MEKYLSRPLIYDVDDAIWINNEKNIGKIAKKAAVILAGNSFIAEWFGKINPNVQIIPTSINTKWFCPGELKTDNVFKIVWTGSHQTLHYLISIERALAKFLNVRKDTLLVVISDSFPEFSNIKPEKVRFIKWSPEAELRSLQESNVGIMPLFDTNWERGKCSFKMLQYMACGIPVLVSSVGMNNEVLSKGEVGISAINDEEWTSGLDFFYNNSGKGKQMGINGVKVVKQHYSLDVITGKLISIFQKY